MNYNHKRLNPPSHWHSPHLYRLYQALLNYQGQDAFDHPYRSQSSLEIGAAVLVLLTHEPSPRLLLTKRSHRLSSHAGEISFVGGRRDDDDTDMAHTALREAMEEVCLCPKAVEIIGYLPCQTAKAGTLVRPVVGLIEPKISDTLIGGESEIERLFWADFEYFLNTPPQAHLIEDSQSTLRFLTPAWQVSQETVWGLTGRILANLLEIGFGQKIAWYYKKY